MAGPNPRTATVEELVELLDSNRTTSADLIEIYYDQITRHNHSGLCLNAIISLGPKEDVLHKAKDLDAERLSKGRRSLLHGIPLIIKAILHCSSLFTEAD